MKRWSFHPRVKAALRDQPWRLAVRVVNLALPLPPSTNELYRNRTKQEIANGKAMGIALRGRARTERYKTWARAAGNALIAAKPGRIEGRYSLTITIAETARMDLGNAEKALSDLLVKHGVVDDDYKARRILLERSAALARHEMLVTVIPYAVQRARAAA